MRFSQDFLDRFWDRVKITHDCWGWTGRAANAGGYPLVTYRGRKWLAHRASWVLRHGPIPDGMCVLHRCDIPRCVNPDHLFLGTHADNVYDAIRKGRHRWVAMS